MIPRKYFESGRQSKESTDKLLKWVRNFKYKSNTKITFLYTENTTKMGDYKNDGNYKMLRNKFSKRSIRLYWGKNEPRLRTF